MKSILQTDNTCRWEPEFEKNSSHLKYISEKIENLLNFITTHRMNENLSYKKNNLNDVHNIPGLIRKGFEKALEIAEEENQGKSVEQLKEHLRKVMKGEIQNILPN